MKKQLIGKKKIQQSLGKDPWNFYYSIEKVENSNEVMKEGIDLEPNTI